MVLFTLDSPNKLMLPNTGLHNILLEQKMLSMVACSAKNLLLALFIVFAF